MTVVSQRKLWMTEILLLKQQQKNPASFFLCNKRCDFGSDAASALSHMHANQKLIQTSPRGAACENANAQINWSGHWSTFPPASSLIWSQCKVQGAVTCCGLHVWRRKCGPHSAIIVLCSYEKTASVCSPVKWTGLVTSNRLECLCRLEQLWWASRADALWRTFLLIKVTPAIVRLIRRIWPEESLPTNRPEGFSS